MGFRIMRESKREAHKVSIYGLISGSISDAHPANFCGSVGGS